MATEKDSEQDRQIRENAERITRNEEAIRRQTEALEKIRDHYYPPPAKAWRKITGFLAKCACAVFAYLGIAETVDWIWNSRESGALARRYATIASRLFSEEGDALGAMNCYAKAIKLDPKESEYLMDQTFMKGLSMAGDFIDLDRPLTSGERARVEAAYSEATVLKELEPKAPLPNVLRAQAFSLNGEKDEAAKAVLQAVACAPNEASVRTSACAILFFAGRLEEARRHLAEAERLNAEAPLVLMWKGALALSIDHDAAAAKRQFENLTRKHPRFPLGHVMLGRTLLMGERPDLKAARAAFARALLLDAKRWVAMLGMAETFEREGRLHLARLWLDQALAGDPNGLSALVSRARIHGKLGNWKAALKDLTAAHALAPFRADILRLRAEAYAKTGDSARAEDDLRTAAEIAASDA